MRESEWREGIGDWGCVMHQRGETRAGGPRPIPMRNSRQVAHSESQPPQNAVEAGPGFMVSREIPSLDDQNLVHLSPKHL